MCHIDVEDVVEPLGQVIKAALLNDVTLICGWSPEVYAPSSCIIGHEHVCMFCQHKFQLGTGLQTGWSDSVQVMYILFISTNVSVL